MHVYFLKKEPETERKMLFFLYNHALYGTNFPRHVNSGLYTGMLPWPYTLRLEEANVPPPTKFNKKFIVFFRVSGYYIDSFPIYHI